VSSSFVSYNPYLIQHGTRLRICRFVSSANEFKMQRRGVVDSHTAVAKDLKDGVGRPRTIGHGHCFVQMGTRCSDGDVRGASRVALTAIDTIAPAAKGIAMQ
jgi:hypothetical protein